jgi:hypothetical protein
MQNKQRKLRREVNMKTTFTGFCFFLFVIFHAAPAYPQITVEYADYDFQFHAGNKLIEYYNTTAASIDVGTGTMTAWDFSAINTDSYHDCSIISAGLTPFRPDYPSAHVAFEYDSSSGNEHNWEYYCRSVYYVHLHGLVFSTLENPYDLRKIIYNPIKIFAAFPLTLNTAWKDTVTEQEKIYQDSTQVSVDETTVITNAVVDAYGTITFPGGKTAEALRAVIREMHEKNGATEEKLFFRWFTVTGETFTAEADPASPTTGIVNVSSIKWVLNSASTDVAEDLLKPVFFKLDQNYPNPFNPSTTISYSLPEESNVELKVFDAIGNETAVLANERKPAGVYTVRFSGQGISSGVYFVRIKAGEFIQARKMILLK